MALVSPAAQAGSPVSVIQNFQHGSEQGSPTINWQRAIVYNAFLNSVPPTYSQACLTHSNNSVSESTSSQQSGSNASDVTVTKKSDGLPGCNRDFQGAVGTDEHGHGALQMTLGELNGLSYWNETSTLVDPQPFSTSKGLDLRFTERVYGGGGRQLEHASGGHGAVVFSAQWRSSAE
ncbi:hypothetical protein BW247_05385 [Acidihalobacter ferrooxydans]|uniref:Uncharacterized protein n=2 Tax=Acidihalobacter ferrooxydans TaxID=1765967 RepID=A0A1P8UFL9_9GAMM|nr:hypothetical protein BW247_05385 [Acidihalobacter ferrooxydans]